MCSRNCSPPTSAPSSSAWCLRCACAGLVLVLPVLVVVLQLELILTKLGRESSNLLLLHSSLLHHPIPAIPSLSLCCFGSVQQPLIHCAVPVVSALHTHSPALCPSSLRDDSSNPPFGCAARPARPAQPSPAHTFPSTTPRPQSLRFRPRIQSSNRCLRSCVRCLPGNLPALSLSSAEKRGPRLDALATPSSS